MRFVAVVKSRHGQTARHEFRSPLDRARFARDVLKATKDVREIRYCEYIDEADVGVRHEWFEVEAGA